MAIAFSALFKLKYKFTFSDISLCRCKDFYCFTNLFFVSSVWCNNSSKQNPDWFCRVVLHADKITGYTSGMAFFSHSVGLTNDDLKALIGSADSYRGPDILIPTRNTHLLQWCLDRGLKLVQQLILMTVGMYNEPAGVYMPSVLYWELQVTHSLIRLLLSLSSSFLSFLSFHVE